jgi:hypothetical protein
MNKNFSDEQLDQILRQIVRDSVLSKEEIDEIADSPNLWWNVQKNIKESKTNHRRGWIPPWFDWRIAAFASAVLIVCIGLIWFANSRNNENFAQIEAVETPPRIVKEEVAEIPQTEDKEQVTEIERDPKISPKKIISSKSNQKLSVSNKPVNHLVKQSLPVKIQPKAEEVKTDFIALNYSPAAESGQILKVKVPRSMMVTLGVTTKIENSSELVNAEVLVGDDGLARAIRFVQ